MKRSLPVSLWLALLSAASAFAAPPLLLSKDATGPLAGGEFAFALYSNPRCDQTARLIPDGSRLVTEGLRFTVPETGVGWFRGPAAVILPDGRPFVKGVIHGTIGIKPCREKGVDARAPGVWVGSFVPAAATGSGSSTDPSGGAGVASTESSETDPPPWEVHFQAVELPTTGPIPLYEARLDGIIPAPEVRPGLITVQTDRLRYEPGQPVTAIVRNAGQGPAAAFAPQSWCTIVRVERKVEDRWQMVGTCATFAPVDPTIIPPGGAVKIVLPPDATQRLEAGIYRCVVIWASLGGDGKPLPERKEAISPMFAVGTAPPSGRVLLYPTKPLYLPGETATAVIANHTTRDIVVYKWYSFCSLVTLERRTATGWEVVQPCMLTGGPAITIKAGEMLKVPMETAPGVPAVLQPGVYRFKLTFSVAGPTGSAAGDPATIYSAPFTVATAPAGRVVIEPTRQVYAPSEHIVALIHNGTLQKVRVFDLQSFCSIVKLEFLKNGQWVMVGECLIDRIPIATYIEPKSNVKVPLPPFEVNTPPKWETGKYRLTLTFGFVKDDGSVMPDVTIHSVVFAVDGPQPGPVVVKPSQAEYLPGQLVTGIIVNEMPSPIRLFDHNSFCSIITMEMLDAAGAWTPAYLCELKSPTQPVILQPKTVTKVGLPEAAIPEFSYRPGTYRLSILFAPVNADGTPLARDVVVKSAPFNVLGRSGTQARQDIQTSSVR